MSVENFSLKNMLEWGTRAEYSDDLNETIRITNQLSVRSILLGLVFFLVAIFFYPSLLFLLVGFLANCFIAFILSIRGNVTIARLLLCAPNAVLGNIAIAYLMPDGQPIYASLIVIQLTFFMTPFVLYSYSERFSLFANAIFVGILIMLFPYLNNAFHGDFDAETFKSGYMQYVCFGVILVFLTDSLFLFLHANHKFRERNSGWIDESNQKNAELEKARQDIENTLLEVQKAHKEDEKRTWIANGLAQGAAILRQSADNEQQMFDDMLLFIVKYLNANQGGLYLVEGHDDNDIHISLKSLYAYERKRYQQRRIEIGQGLLGRCYLEQETIFLKDVPQNYTQITSGLGAATPTCITIVPLKLNDAVEGLLELASFQVLEAHEVEFLERLSETLSSSIRNARIAQHTQALLRMSQEQAEQMRQQEEMMRQNVEELQATQEEMMRTQQVMATKEANLQALLNNIEAAVVSVDRDYNLLTINKQMVEMYRNKGIQLKEGTNLLKQLSAEEAADRKEQFDKALAGESFTFTERIISPITNQPAYFDISFMPIYDEDEKVIGLTSMSKNVTEAQNLRQEIERKKSMLEAVINAYDDNILVLDRQYNVVMVNKGYRERYKQMGIDYYDGMNAFQVIAADARDEWKGYYDRALAGETYAFTLEFKDAQGNPLRRQYAFYPIYGDGNRAIIGLALINRLLN